MFVVQKPLRNDGGFRAWLNHEGKKFIGSTRHGLNAYADAEVDRRRMCEANVSMASLEAVVAAIKAAAAARDAERSERAWKKQRLMEVTAGNESGASQPESGGSKREPPNAADGGGSKKYDMELPLLPI